MLASLKPDIQVQVRGVGKVQLQPGERHVMAGLDRQQLVALIARFSDDAREVGTQGLYVRLHARARTPLGPQQPFGKLRRPGSLSLRPDDERLAQLLFPFSQRAPQVAVRTSQRLRRMANRAQLQNRAEQVKQRIAERRAALLAGLESIAQVQSERGLGLRRTFAIPHLPPRDSHCFSRRNCSRERTGCWGTSSLGRDQRRIKPMVRQDLLSLWRQNE